MDKLQKAIVHLKEWQKENRGNTSNRCLEAVRHALGAEGLILPSGSLNGRSMWAIECFSRLAEDPGEYGFVVTHTPLTGVCLVFFKQCGYLPHRKEFAGHVGILDVDAKKCYSNTTTPWNDRWASRIVGAFLPL